MKIKIILSRFLLIQFFLFLSVCVYSQEYPSLNELKQQKILFELKQNNDSLLQLGKIPQLIPFIGGRLGLEPRDNRSKSELENSLSFKFKPILLSGMRYRYQRWELEALFGLNVSINSDSYRLDVSDRWLVESNIKYRYGITRNFYTSIGYGWQPSFHYIYLGSGYEWKNKKEKIITIYSNINLFHEKNEVGILIGVNIGFGKKGLDKIGMSLLQNQNPSSEIPNPSLKLLDKLKSMQSLSVGETVSLLTKALNIGNTITISQQDPLKVTYSPSIQLPLSKAWSVGIGPNISMLYDSLHTNWSFGGRVFTRVQPKKWLPYLQVEYSGLYEADSVAISSEGINKSNTSSWKSDILVGAGYSLKIGRLFSIEASAMRKTGWVDPVSGNPWQFQVSTKKEIPFAVPELDQLEIPSSTIDLGKFLKVGGGINMTIGENPGIEAAPQIYKTLGVKKKINIGLSPLLRYSRVADKDLWVYGGRIFSQYTPFKGYPHLDGEIEGMNASDPSQPEYKRHWYPSLRAGTGYTFQFGDFFGISFQLLYSFVYEEDGNPIQNEPWVFRIGFNGIGGK